MLHTTGSLRAGFVRLTGRLDTNHPASQPMTNGLVDIDMCK